MKICDSWLRQYVDHGLDPDELADRLTMLGLEVESLSQAGNASAGLLAGRVVETRRHPAADRLTLCDVDVGTGTPVKIVCGATNVRAGGTYVAALPGARLPGGLVIKATTIRGESSAGMLCSAGELGLDAAAEGLLELDPGTVPGADVNAILDLGDYIIDLNVTPNRADCFSVIGVAREVSASIDVDIRHRNEIRVAAVIEDRLPLGVADPADAPRFAGRIIRDLDPQARTPLWMSERLRRCGVRPIHPVVDVTNYVMLETGQPMHAYDMDRLDGGGIQVRRARQGESLVVLGGQAVQLEGDMLVIAGESGAIGLAGIIGGQATSVSGHSHNIFLESAFFSPSAVTGRARRLGLHTEASLRFERGVDPTGQVNAIERATDLILGIAGGKAGPVSELSCAENLPVRKKVQLRRSRLSRILGVDLASADVVDILRRLDIKFEGNDEGWGITAPAARFDLEKEEDFVEEVARVFGYERIPAAVATSEVHLAAAAEEPDPIAVLRAGMVARGFQEVITYSFINGELARQFGATEVPQLTLSNPISADMAVMRQSLWPGLAEVARNNLNRQQDRLRLFEIGVRFSGTEDGHAEGLGIAGLVLGDRYPRQWGLEPIKADVFDLKSEVEALLGLSGINQAIGFEPASHPALHPGRSAAILKEGIRIGWFGEIHPGLAADLGIPHAGLFELDAAVLLERQRSNYFPFSRFPALRRDLAVVVSQSVRVSALLDVVKRSAQPLLREAFVFDIYTGPQIAMTEKSVAIGLILQGTSRTLTDAEADTTLHQVRADLARELQVRFRE